MQTVGPCRGNIPGGRIHPNRNEVSDAVCGLLGLLTTDGTSDDAVAKVDSAMHCLRHRGPD